MLLGDALRLMDKVDQRGAPVPFSISWCTLDRKRGSGKEPGGMADALKKAPITAPKHKGPPGGSPLKVAFDELRPGKA
jgi:hypothetical protein